MASRINQPWIPIEKIEELVQLEPTLAIAGLALSSWLFYKFFLRGVTQERHRNLKALFRNLLGHSIIGTVAFLIYFGLERLRDLDQAPAGVERIITYVGVVALFWGLTVFVKTARILLFEYLFLSHMREAVPLLLVNIFTLLLSFGLGGWAVTELLNFKVIPVLATSAIFSVILGLALQDTLGNLFAGIALQFDKPYELGDWIEVQATGQKWVGQVKEVSWRATGLTGFSDEALTIPNRVIAQAQISNFSTRHHPILRSQVFRLSYDVDVPRAKSVLVQAAKSVPGLRKNPEPLCIVTETHDSWQLFKLVYFIDDYGSQFLIGDQVIQAAVSRLSENKIPLASSRLLVVSHDPT